LRDKENLSGALGKIFDKDCFWDKLEKLPFYLHCSLPLKLSEVSRDFQRDELRALGCEISRKTVVITLTKPRWFLTLDPLNNGECADEPHLFGDFSHFPGQMFEVRRLMFLSALSTAVPHTWTKKQAQ